LRHVSSENALDYIAGYTCANEGSVREYQRKTSQWTIGKNFDLSGSMGPFFVSADEVPPGGKGLKIECRLNGEVMQSANTDSMLCDVPMAIELLGAALALEPGDLILTGTPEGVGHARTPQIWLKPGDTIAVEIEKIGLLQNLIVAEE
jgi:acylpyruvate hydrolase